MPDNIIWTILQIATIVGFWSFAIGFLVFKIVKKVKANKQEKQVEQKEDKKDE